MVTVNWNTSIPSAPDATYIVVDSIALSATETNVRDFFAFCGPIEILELQKQESGSQRALIKFSNAEAAKTSLLLSNALINYEPIHVSPLFAPGAPTAATAGPSQGAEHRAPHDYEGKPALYVVHELLAAGYLVGEHVVGRASEFDSRYRVTDRTTEQARSLDSQYKFSHYLQQWDDKFNLTQRAKQAYDKFQSHPVGSKVVLTVNDAYKSALQLSQEARELAERKRANDEQLFGKIPLPPPRTNTTRASGDAQPAPRSNTQPSSDAPSSPSSATPEKK